MLRIVVAPDSFKGSLTATEAARLLRSGMDRGFQQGGHPWQAVEMPMSDGGEGFVACVLAVRGGRRMRAEVAGPDGGRVVAEFALLPGGTAVIELASAAGWRVRSGVGGDRWRASTRGVGELVSAALDRGARRIIVGLGGSVTHDAGAGMVRALGIGMYDAAGEPIPEGARGLPRLSRVDISRRDPRLSDVELVAAHDVNSPLLGPAGAAAVYGPQKGFRPEEIAPLDEATAHFARLVEEAADRRHGAPGATVWSQMPGSGSAGGTGFGMAALLGARLVPGARWLLEEAGAEEIFRTADLVVTGEGRMDHSTLNDKLPVVVARTARDAGIPAVAVCGALAVSPAAFLGEGISAVLPAVREPMDTETAMARAPALLEEAGFTLASLLSLGGLPIAAGREGRFKPEPGAEPNK